MEASGKELKEIEITEYPDNPKFSDFKTSKIENKTISVLKQSVYVFRFKNSALIAKKRTKRRVWVGVGEEANQAWQANVKTIQSVVKMGAVTFTTPLGALAIGAVVDLLTPKLGEDVYYAVADEQNKNLFMAGLAFRAWDNGKGVAGYKKFSGPSLCQGTYFICMSNDNYRQGIDATVKVIAIVERSEYEDKTYPEMLVNPSHEKQLNKEPVIRTYKAPVTEI